MASKHNETIVPTMQAPEPPKRFFTADEADYPNITKWLEGNKLEYNRFYPSFLNHAINTARRRADPKTKKGLSQTDNAMLWVFDDDVPVQTQGFIDAMSAYGSDHYDGGVTSGSIDLENDRKADIAEIEGAEKQLAELLYSVEKRKELLKEQPQLDRLFLSGKAKRKGKKTQKRAEKRMTSGVGGLGLEEGDEEAEE
ncbi:hypothetical protein LTR37_009488 [Vermiconidia calcicola]|uniref:Uncharacterized protein n=1 Tax=Vermiconidia calcicola TaxID=1690605 RepID=A0ACC3N7W0_9PEZI|nr:hypothetical protein LTR37_009488 [Vermiconidia calcicola]